jgi:YfiR/HmsC-like
VENLAKRGHTGQRWRNQCWFRGFRPKYVCFAILTITGMLAGIASLLPASEVRVEAGLAALPESNPSVEYQVKAAFLFNFAKFVDWPPEAFPSEKAPITFCVFRQDPFGGVLDETIRGKTINNHEVLARRINQLPELKSCQLVFVSSKEGKLLSEILNSLKGASALVVGESEGFAERGGGIQFFLEDNRLRFAVNVDAVQRARLTVSAKLLALARIVHDPGHSKGN